MRWARCAAALRRARQQGTAQGCVGSGGPVAEGLPCPPLPTCCRCSPPSTCPPTRSTSQTASRCAAAATACSPSHTHPGQLRAAANSCQTGLGRLGRQGACQVRVAGCAHVAARRIRELRTLHPTWLCRRPASPPLPPPQVVPVYSLPEDGNTLTRAYTACPTYDARLLDWWAGAGPRQRRGQHGVRDRTSSAPWLPPCRRPTQALTARRGSAALLSPCQHSPAGPSCSARCSGRRACAPVECGEARVPSAVPCTAPPGPLAGTSLTSSRPRRPSPRRCGTASPPTSPASTPR